ncbi:MAG: rhodanese-like domain-containing protein [Trueperaceae bacterium]|nr:rhodanese-like domain-containing protein [Trueperaceae bacterium]
MKKVSDMVAEAKAEIKSLSIKEALEKHGAGEVVFVDLRDIRELEREGKIAGAMHAPRGMLEFWVDPESPYHKEIFSSGKNFVFYCSLGWRSALATKAVQDMGLVNVADIEGGFSAWKEAGGQLESYERKSREG